MYALRERRQHVTQEDFEWRRVRSAAPTPDTAHPNKTFKLWPRDEKEDDIAEEDEAEDEDAGADAANDHAYLKAVLKLDDAQNPCCAA